MIFHIKYFCSKCLVTYQIFEICVPDKIVCYFGSWANYRLGDGKFFVDDIDPTLCTHVIYTFVGLSDDGSVTILDPNNEISNGNREQNIISKIPL